MRSEPCHKERRTSKTIFTLHFQVHHMFTPSESMLQAFKGEIWGQQEMKGLYSELTTGRPSGLVDIERTCRLSPLSCTNMFQQDVW